MFELTRGEQTLVIGFVLVFLLGFGVRQWREASGPTPAAASTSE